MINTIQIHYDYDETEGILPSGLPKGPAHCHKRCPFLNTEGEAPMCDLFMVIIDRTLIGEPKRESFIPAYACRNHEMQGR